MLDNLRFEKIWQDSEFMEVRVTASSELAWACQNFYAGFADVRSSGEIMAEYSPTSDKPRYIEFGKKQGNYTPAFSLSLQPTSCDDAVKIEVDVEVDDNDRRAHRCAFYVVGSLGRLNELGRKLTTLADASIGTSCALVPCNFECEKNQAKDAPKVPGGCELMCDFVDVQKGYECFRSIELGRCADREGLESSSVRLVLGDASSRGGWLEAQFFGVSGFNASDMQGIVNVHMDVADISELQWETRYMVQEERGAFSFCCKSVSFEEHGPAER